MTHPQFITGNEIIAPVTAEQMSAAYFNACEKVDTAYKMLADAEQELKMVFGRYVDYTSFDLVPANGRYFDSTKPGETIKQIKKNLLIGTWRRILQILEISKITSEKRQNDIEKKLESGNLPEPTANEIMALLESFVQQAPDILKETAQEVYKALRPDDDYVTNNYFQIGERVVLKYYVENGYGNTPFRASYYHDHMLVMMDRLFSLLDGKGIPDGYKSPLVDAINTSPTGRGKTTYFEFKCHQNRNLHIRFLRMDLVQKMNELCGGSAELRGKRKGKRNQ